MQMPRKITVQVAIFSEQMFAQQLSKPIHCIAAGNIVIAFAGLLHENKQRHQLLVLGMQCRHEFGPARE